MSFFEILAYGGQVTAIGLLTVFMGLILIILCINAMSAVFKSFDKSKTAKTESKPEAPAPAPAAAPAPIEEAPVVEDEYVTDPQVIAVIAAAIAAYDSNRNLVVRSVRRVSGWKKAARDEVVCRF